MRGQFRHTYVPRCKIGTTTDNSTRRPGVWVRHVRFGRPGAAGALSGKAGNQPQRKHIEPRPPQSNPVQVHGPRPAAASQNQFGWGQLATVKTAAASLLQLRWTDPCCFGTKAYG